MSASVLFCGSFQHYSAMVLAGLLEAGVQVIGVVTTPAAEVKKGSFWKNGVQLLAENSQLPVFTPTELSPEVLAEIEAQVGKAEILLTAGYGKLVPKEWLSWPSLQALNLHFSLLPKWRGANPAEWALLCGDTQTGVTLIEMSPSFDTGNIVATAPCPITNDDTRETVYEKLYELGGRVLPDMLAFYTAFSAQTESETPEHSEITFYWPPEPQTSHPTPTAARFNRNDGFIDWRAVETVMSGQIAEANLVSLRLQQVLAYTNDKLDAKFVERAMRALAGFPSLWTKIPTAKGEKRMKLLSGKVNGTQLELQMVQIEGKPPTKWAESKNIIE